MSSGATTEAPTMDVKVVSQEMALLSNILAAYTFIADQPERTALVFLGGVCAGLLVTLVAIVFQIHCRADCHYRDSKDLKRPHGSRAHRRHRHSGGHHPTGDPVSACAALVPGRTEASGDSEQEEVDETADLSARRRRRFERALVQATMFTSSEELDRAQRLEERERILREIWMNGQPDISTVTQSLNRYY